MLNSQGFPDALSETSNAAADIGAPIYRWSTDLETFHANGASDGAGTTVTFSCSPNDPQDGTTTVIATIEGTPHADKIFVRLSVTQLP